MFYGAMAIRSSGRRRGLALVSIAVVALSISLAIPGMTTTAGANAGNVTVAVDLALVTPTFQITGITTRSPATATIGADGTIDIPQAGIVFAPIAVNIGAPNPDIGAVTVQALANSDFVGIVDPASHLEWLAGRVELDLTQPGTMTGCKIGPFNIVVTTQSTGSRPYSASTGAATMVDENFAVSAVDPNASGCGEWQTSVNSALSLPIATTTTTTAMSTTTTSTTTTTVPTPDTTLSDLVPDTPVPAFVMSTTMTPAPQAPAPPRTTPPTTAHPPTGAPTPTTQAPVTHGTAPNQIVPGPTPTPTAQPGGHVTTHHRTRSATNPHKKRHPRRHKTKAKPRVRVVLPPAPASRTGGRAGPTNRAGLIAPGRIGQPPAAGDGTVIDAMLASSKHRSAPSSLNYLAILALLVSGVYAAKLLKPDIEQVLHAHRRPRRRLFGIDPPGK
jgi:hypothetical protein